MRVNAVTDVDSRDGVSNKDERLTNMIAEKDGQVTLACIRPALNTLLASSGDGNGLVCFNSQIFHVFGTALKYGTTPTSVSTVVDGVYDFVAMP